jgi:hypothetical protein
MVTSWAALIVLARRLPPGPLDDVVIIALAMRYAARQVPRQILLDAWPGNPGVLERLLGPAPSPS